MKMPRFLPSSAGHSARRPNNPFASYWSCLLPINVVLPLLFNGFFPSIHYFIQVQSPPFQCLYAVLALRVAYKEWQLANQTLGDVNSGVWHNTIGLQSWWNNALETTHLYCLRSDRKSHTTYLYNHSFKKAISGNLTIRVRIVFRCSA